VAEAVIEAGLPLGVINIVPGGREAGAYLVTHPAVDKVTFTGPTAAGRQIGEVCGRLLRPVTLELGGKSAAIALDDADLGSAIVARNLAPALFANNGQTCFLTSRVLAPRSRYDEVVDAIAALARSLIVGSSLYPATQMGRWCARASAPASRDTSRRGSSKAPGWFVEPTLFADVDNSLRIAREEIFGPTRPPRRVIGSRPDRLPSAGRPTRPADESVLRTSAQSAARSSCSDQSTESSASATMSGRVRIVMWLPGTITGSTPSRAANSAPGRASAMSSAHST
jgi:hypothetical protein